MKITNLKLNFLDNYYMFYEWLLNDDVEINKDVYLYKVSPEIVSDMINYKIKLNNIDLLNKTNCLLFSDGYSFIAIEFDQRGYSQFKSSLLLQDEIKLLDKVDSLKKIKINYEIISKENECFDLRINEEIRNTIKIEINNLVLSNNVDKLGYLYYEWFNKKENNVDKMIKVMNKKISSPLTNREKEIYYIIKRSYKLV